MDEAPNHEDPAVIRFKTEEGQKILCHLRGEIDDWTHQEANNDSVSNNKGHGDQPASEGGESEDENFIKIPWSIEFQRVIDREDNEKNLLQRILDKSAALRAQSSSTIPSEPHDERCDSDSMISTKDDDAHANKQEESTNSKAQNTTSDETSREPSKGDEVKESTIHCGDRKIEDKKSEKCKHSTNKSARSNGDSDVVARRTSPTESSSDPGEFIVVDQVRATDEKRKKRNEMGEFIVIDEVRLDDSHRRKKEKASDRKDRRPSEQFSDIESDGELGEMIVIDSVRSDDKNHRDKDSASDKSRTITPSEQFSDIESDTEFGDMIVVDSVKCND